MRGWEEATEMNVNWLAPSKLDGKWGKQNIQRQNENAARFLLQYRVILFEAKFFSLSSRQIEFEWVIRCFRSCDQELDINMELAGNHIPLSTYCSWGKHIFLSG